MAGTTPQTETAAQQAFQAEIVEKIIGINRVSKVTKGMKRLSFSALVVVGDTRGNVGYALGKAREVADAIRKAVNKAKKAQVSISRQGTTIPHEVTGKVGGAIVLLKPASRGTGVVAGGGVRAVVEAAGVRDILTKSLGSANILNVAKATMDALDQLRSPEDLAEMRGKPAKELLPLWERRKNG